MSSQRTIETTISVDNIASLIEPFLYQIGLVKHKEEIIKLELVGFKGTVPIKVTVKVPQPVEVTIFGNGVKE